MNAKLVLGLALCLAGCGGSTDSDSNGSNGGSGGASTGGSSSGGASSGGASSGGASSGGASTGGSSSGGSGNYSWCGPLPGDPTCAPDAYCNLLNCQVSNSEGFCVPEPQGCTDDCPGVCGCDGKFYCNACSAQQAGVDVSDDKNCIAADGGTTKTCGGFTGALCGADEYCEYANGCGLAGGVGECKKKPLGCDTDCPGVCGCDGKFYCNECNANSAGVGITGDKSCMSSGDAGVGLPCPNGTECAKGLLCCYPCGIPGCDNQCMPPDPSGGCPLFP
jgi:hypothetical protein